MVNPKHTSSVIVKKIDSRKIGSIIYHDIFEYPLTRNELNKWILGKDVRVLKKETVIFHKKHYLLSGKEAGVDKKLERKKISSFKMGITTQAVYVLARIPTILCVLVTGSLAMDNSVKRSDIDLMVITKSKTLWSTRLISYFLLKISGFHLRKPRAKEEKDRLCLNMWIDEDNLIWPEKDRNIFTAHEIAQITPVLNRGGYGKFINANLWAKKYWPNAIVKHDYKYEKHTKPSFFEYILKVIEPIAMKIQLVYMKRKITREIVLPGIALFHPVDWSKNVSRRLGKKLSFTI